MILHSRPGNQTRAALFKIGLENGGLYTYAGPAPTVVGVKEIEGHKNDLPFNARVFMNNGTLHFNIPGKEIQRTEIRDLQGRTLFKSNDQLLSNGYILPGKFSKGVYLVRLTGRDQSYFVPVIYK